MEILIAAVLSAAGGASLAILWDLARKMLEQQKSLVDQVVEMQKSVNDMKDALKNKRLPYPVLDGLDDVSAGLIHLIASEHVNATKRVSYLNLLLGQNRTLRTDFRAYPSNAVSGREKAAQEALQNARSFCDNLYQLMEQDINQPIHENWEGKSFTVALQEKRQDQEVKS